MMINRQSTASALCTQQNHAFKLACSKWGFHAAERKQLKEHWVKFKLRWLLMTSGYALTAGAEPIGVAELGLRLQSNNAA